MNLRVINGEIYVKSILSKIELLKELLLLDVELGSSVYLCDEFNMNDLPLSFRYYDPILRIIIKKLNPKRERFYLDQKHLAKMFFDNSTKQQLLKHIGFKKDIMEPKLEINYKPINEVVRKEINFKYSKHAKCHWKEE